MVKLLSLALKDFRGIRNAEICPEGNSITVRGANGSGKSTLMNAFLWLLTGKDAQGRADYNIFPLAEDGQRVPGCFPTVTAQLLIDGSRMVLTRALAEKWTKRRGAAESEYAGDETKCTIDDVPVSVTEYNQRLAGLCCPALTPVLLNASYFSEQTKDYKERRKLLLTYFGGLKEMDILQSSPTLAPLIQMLDGHSVEEYRRICTERRKKYNDAMNAIPARIDENRKQLSEAVGDEQYLRGQIGERNVAIAKLRYDLEHTTEGTIQRDAQKKLDAVNEKLSVLPRRRKMMKDLAAGDWLKKHNAELEQALKEKQDAATALQEADGQRASLMQKKARLESEIQEMRGQWVRRNGQVDEVATICPTCGQEIPPEQVQEARERCNLRKANELDEITAKAKSKQAELAQVVQELEATRPEQECAEVTYAECCRQYDAIAAEKPPAVDPEVIASMDWEEKQLKAQAAELQAYLLDTAQAAKDAGQAQREEITNLQAEVEALQRKLAEIQRAAAVKARIAELQQQQKQALEELERAEQGLTLCEEYTRQMVAQLTEKVNENFSQVSWRLFETQKNGGLKEICEAEVDGVPYGALNTASKMQANVEIVRAFALASGYQLPLFLDNRESVSTLDIPETMQVINLQVDPAAVGLSCS